MPKENNKMQVDIDTLKKQNVNDLLSIKELYKRIEDLAEKTTQIKYIDNTLVKKIKKEYENLKKIILDENVQIKISNDIKTINSQMDTKANKSDIETINSHLDTKANKSDIETINLHLDTKANKDDIETINSHLDTNTQENSTQLGMLENTDISVRLQELVNNTNINYIKFKTGTYKMSSIVNINRNNLTIDFNNSTIEWLSYNEINNSHRNKAIINVSGKDEVNTLKLIDINPYNVEKGYLSFNVNDSSTLNVGDYIRLYINCDGYNENNINPTINITTKIINKTSEGICIDYRCPYKFTFSDIVSSEVVKVKPIEGINIYNVKIKDLTDIHNSQGGLSKWISGLTFSKCSNCSCENFSISNHKLLGISIINSYNINLKNISAFNAQLVDDGHGYCVQCGSSTKLILENIYGDNIRHITDFTGCSFSTLKNCVNLGTTTSITYACHGQYDHDLYYDNVIGGSFSINHGEVFGNMVTNITFNNCKGRWAYGECQNTYFNNCDIYIEGHFHQNTVIKNSRITFPLCYANLNKPKRGIGSSITFDGCIFNPLNENSTKLGLCSFDSIEFINCKLISNFSIDLFFRNTKEVFFNNCKLTNVTITHLKDNSIIGDEFNIKLIDNEIVNTVDLPFDSNIISMNNASNLFYKLHANNNKFINKSANRVKPFRTSPSSTCTYEFIFNNNILKGIMSQDLNQNGNNNITSIFIGNYYNTSSKPSSSGVPSNFDSLNNYKEYVNS